MKKKATKTQKQPDYQSPKPLWRFGWAGWTLLPITIALGIVYFSGYDLRTLLFNKIYELFGIDTLYFFLLRFILPSGLSFGRLPPEPIFTVIGAWCVLVGAAIHPRKFGLWRDVLMLLVALAIPGIWLTLMSRSLLWFSTSSGSTPWVTILHTFVPLGPIAIIAALATFLLYRARLVALVVLCLGFLGVWFTLEFNLFTINGNNLLLPKGLAWNATFRLGWVYYPAVLAASLYWGITARRASVPPWTCQACRYDLRGCLADLCPECGLPRAPDIPEPLP